MTRSQPKQKSSVKKKRFVEGCQKQPKGGVGFAWKNYYHPDFQVPKLCSIRPLEKYVRESFHFVFFSSVDFLPFSLFLQKRVYISGKQTT